MRGMAFRRSSPASRAARRLALALIGLLALVGLAGGQEAGGPETPALDRVPTVLVTDITGAIGPPTTRQISELIEAAEARGAALAVIRIDTPGGLVTSTRDINRAILAAEVPVAVFVAPPGARAASAGTYILYASHLAAMAPGTNVGAATPVQMGGRPGLPDEDAPESPAEDASDKDDETASDDADPATNSGRLANKAINDAVAQIRSLAELRGRDADWAERAVRGGESLSAEAALERGVIEILAADMPALLEAADGREIALGERTLTLRTADARVITLEPSLVTKLLGILANPNVAILLMTLGFYGLLFELSSPGLGPGIPGAICLLLGLYALNLLPVDYAGLALVGLGLALMAAEAVTPSFGVLGIGGTLAFAIGAAVLIDTDIPAYQISWTLIAALAALSALFVTLVIGAILRTRGGPDMAGEAAMVGLPARVIDWEGARGHVHAHGERWIARGPDGLAPGTKVEIRAVDGLTLEVGAPMKAPNPASSGETR